MNLLAPCRTPKAILLCAVKDEKGVLRFPEGGILFTPAPLSPVNPELVKVASDHFHIDAARHLEIIQEFADELVTADGEEATLYLATLKSESGFVAPSNWPSMPDILRSHTGRKRIPYLRAWQVFAGGLHLNTKAIDAAELAKHFDD